MVTKILLITGVLLAIALLVLGIIQARNNADIARIWRSVQIESPSQQRFFSADMVADLPKPVQRYFLHAIAPGTLIANSVHLTMNGTIRLAPEQDWMPLQAEELLSTKGFVWQATVGQGIVQMRGADYYTAGDGRMRFSWGLIPIVNAHNPDVLRSAIGRWIGEYFWLPSALLPQRGVSWQAIDENTIQASLKADSEPITLTFVIDAQGRLLKSSFPRWGNQTEDKHYSEIPFGGEYQAEQTFSGYTIPSQMGAGWWIDTESYFEFFRTTIEQAQFR